MGLCTQFTPGRASWQEEGRSSAKTPRKQFLILRTCDPSLSAKAEESLAQLDVVVRTNTLFTDVQNGTVTLRTGEQTEQVPSCAVLWAAGTNAGRTGGSRA